MAQDIKSFFFVMKRTKELFFCKIKGSFIGGRGKAGEISTEYIQDSITDLTGGSSHDQYIGKYEKGSDLDISRDSSNCDQYSLHLSQPNGSSPTGITSEIKVEALDVPDGTTEYYGKRIEFEKIDESTGESKSETSSNDKICAIPGPARGNVGMAKGKKTEIIESEDIERLRQEIDLIEKAIVEHIEYTMIPQAGGVKEALEELFKKMGWKE